jgi:gluconokinase
MVARDPSELPPRYVGGRGWRDLRWPRLRLRPAGPAPALVRLDREFLGLEKTHLIVMGVAGCGKSTVAAGVAGRLALLMLEGDAFHSAHNVAKMRAGQPLDDADRSAWLADLAAALAAQSGPCVLSCSALKRAYREQLRQASAGLCFAFLEIAPEAARARVAARRGHFFSDDLIRSQFATLESPVGEARVLRLDAAAPPGEIEAAILAWWPERGPGASQSAAGG